MKVICIHHRLAGMTGHRFNEACSFVQEFKRRGREFLLLSNVGSRGEIATQLNARPVLEDPTFCKELSFEERTARFLAMLHEQIDDELNADDRVLITVSTQLEANALRKWLHELPQTKKPWIIILIVSDRWNRFGRDEYERQISEFHVLSAGLRDLALEEARRLIFCSLTDGLAAELSGLLGVPVAVSPIPLAYEAVSAHMPSLSNSRARLPQVALLGGTRHEKGSHLVPDIIRVCRSRMNVEFLVHLANENLRPEESERVARVAWEPGVHVIREPMSVHAYNHALMSSDIGLFPYEIKPYRKRISGVFSEAVAYGKPVVAPRGTWMAQQLEAGHAAGTVFENLEPDSIAEAVGRCVADLRGLNERARILSTEWKEKRCLSAFVDFMEIQIAQRMSG